jgi:hypothetical protein
MNRWWGYLHTDGSIHAKRYFDKRDLTEAAESPFVDQIIQPFDAASSGDALRTVNAFFNTVGHGVSNVSGTQEKPSED